MLFLSGGDLTDDNYSTFTDVQQQKKPLDKKLERRNQMKEFQRMERASQSQTFKENPNQLLPPKNLDKQQLMLKSSQVHPNPEKHIEEFAKLLISKLAAHKKELDDKKLLKEKLGQVGDGDSSVASLGATTADQQKKRRYQQQVILLLPF